MSPRDVVAIRFLAKLLERTGEGYNPLQDDEQAQELVEKFGLQVTTFRKRKKGPDAPSGVWEVSHKGRFLYSRSANYPRSRRAAIVYGACVLHDPNWDAGITLLPWDLEGVVDARS